MSLGGEKEDILETEAGPAGKCGEGGLRHIVSLGHKAAGRLGADGHEAAVGGHDEQVETQPERHDPHPRQAPVDPAEEQEQDEGKDQPGGGQFIRKAGTDGRQVSDQHLGKEGEDNKPGLAQGGDHPLAVLKAGKKKPGEQPDQDGNQQDHFLVRKPPAVRRSAGAQDEEDDGEQGEGDLDMLAVDLVDKGE